jgi:hypothetical protein
VGVTVTVTGGVTVTVTVGVTVTVCAGLVSVATGAVVVGATVSVGVTVVVGVTVTVGVVGSCGSSSIDPRATMHEPSSKSASTVTQPQPATRPPLLRRFAP